VVVRVVVAPPPGGFFMPFFDEWLEFQAGISKKTNENSI